MPLFHGLGLVATLWLAGEDLESILRWHQSTIDGIRSVSCDVQLEWNHPDQPHRNQTRKGRYRRQGDQIMITDFGSDATIYTRIRDGTCLELTRSANRVALWLGYPEKAGTFMHVENRSGIGRAEPHGLRGRAPAARFRPGWVVVSQRLLRRRRRPWPQRLFAVWPHSAVRFGRRALRTDPARYRPRPHQQSLRSLPFLEPARRR